MVRPTRIDVSPQQQLRQRLEKRGIGRPDGPC
ncbi:unnamed protein product [Gongylonema pulchrum]|uniref:Protein-L-isoaspartate O-methyltransferase n=1 Tax=Gongylonema pulchrum TaxID=637853 RepID=A0A183F176_9BILA|nr:unnamed protein product [Gongylonema pulchrum]